ncbi:unnamed protein product [Rotaria socialis]|uniref:Uncharacterized protein n=1 Tax=Rotaria socialis TaxID=392032 RepID=A0A821P2B8_9BILA|nr:unnamed protein product [Rotaria socialis]
MPPKGRIDEEIFLKTLRTLHNDEIRMLDDSKARANIWGHICTSMDKADNVVNRRACYDLWKRKRHICNNLINDTLSVGFCNFNILCIFIYYFESSS